jgi:threonine dehydrogenase-like Zn-dependent dehydrogenase
MGSVLGGGGWIFSHLIDGLQAEYARVPFADNSVHKVPEAQLRHSRSRSLRRVVVVVVVG